jgi:hypothetical protein
MQELYRIVQQRDEHSNLLDREVEIPASPDEREALDVFAGMRVRCGWPTGSSAPPPGEEPDERRQPLGHAHHCRHGDRRREQRPERGGDHRTGREAQRRVEQSAVAEDEHRPRTCRSRRRRKQGREQAWPIGLSA